MNENYKAWNIDISAYPRGGTIAEQIAFLLKFAVLAPSGHNSQPWEFKISNNQLDILVNQERALEGSDPDHRQLMLGIGCMLGNLFVAADYYGLSYRTTYAFTVSSDPVAKILFQEISDQNTRLANLLLSIPHRITNRGAQDTAKPVPAQLIAEIKNLATPDMQIDYISDRNGVSSIGDAIVRFQLKAMDDSAFRNELSHFINNNWTSSKTGMIAGNFGIPAPATLLAPTIIRAMNVNRKTIKKDKDIFQDKTTGYLILSLKNESLVDWMNTGICFEKIWLMVTRDELALAPNAAPIQFTEGRSEIQKIIRSEYIPVVIARIGYCKDTPKRTPRLEVEGVVR